MLSFFILAEHTSVLDWLYWSVLEPHVAHLGGDSYDESYKGVHTHTHIYVYVCIIIDISNMCIFLL